MAASFARLLDQPLFAPLANHQIKSSSVPAAHESIPAKVYCTWRAISAYVIMLQVLQALRSSGDQLPTRDCLKQWAELRRPEMDIIDHQIPLRGINISISA